MNRSPAHKATLREAGGDFIELLLTKHSRPWKRERNGDVTFALRLDDTHPSCEWDSKKCLWCDRADNDKGGDIFTLIARLEGLDEDRDFTRILEIAERLSGIQPPPDPPTRAPKATKKAKAAEKETPGPAVGIEAFCGGYGLEWADFEALGCSRAARPFHKVNGWIESIVYPYRKVDGTAVEKWRSIARSEKSGHRFVGAPSNSGFQFAVFGSTPEQCAGLVMVLTAGEEKAIAGIKTGFPSISLATGEKPPSDAVAAWIASWAPKAVIVAMDNDKAGNDATTDAILSLRKAGIQSVLAVEWPTGTPDSHDLADVLREEGTPGLSFLLHAAKEVGEAEAISRHTNCTDIGNARRFAKRARGIALFNIHDGVWYFYDKTRWVGDVASIRALALAQEVAEAIFDEAHADGYSKDIMQWGIKSCELRRRKTMVEDSIKEKGMNAPASDFDKDPDLLNVLNGTLNLKTGEMRPHDPLDRITKMAPVRYDKKAQCPTFMRFIRRIMNGDEEMVRFLQRAFGYALCGSTKEQKLFMFHGTGSNGKSTLLQTMIGMLGDYGGETDPKVFTGDSEIGSDRPRADLCHLVGRRLVAAAELEQGSRFSEALVKRLTGEDTMSIRQLQGVIFEWKPTMKVFMSFNYRPRIRGMDDGIWRRFYYINFNVKIEGAEKDADLPAKLKAEWSGILNWAIEGFLQWQAQGLNPPESVVFATDKFRTDSDPIQQFINDRCIRGDANTFTLKSIIYSAYSAHATANGGKPMSHKAFSEIMSMKGFLDPPGSGNVGRWQGLSLQPSPDPYPAGAEGPEDEIDWSGNGRY